MIFTLVYIVLAGLLLKSFYTHYISEKRKYFSFDDRRFTDDDYLKVQDLGLRRLERTFLFIMLALFILALCIHVFLDPVLSVWLIALSLTAMLMLSLIVDFKLYTVAYDKSHLVMAAVWLLVIVGMFLFLFIGSTNDIEMNFEEERAVMLPEEISFPYTEIDSIDMTSEIPDLPFNHNLLGTHSQLHGYMEGESALYSLNVENRSGEMILIVTGNVHTYINNEDETVTSEWYDMLRAQVE